MVRLPESAFFMMKESYSLLFSIVVSLSLFEGVLCGLGERRVDGHLEHLGSSDNFLNPSASIPSLR